MLVPTPSCQCDDDSRNSNKEAGYKKERVRAVLPENSSSCDEEPERDGFGLHHRTHHQVSTDGNHHKSPDPHDVTVTVICVGEKDCEC